ncbi:MAG: GGDEF domain-containing protein [Terracidiphilus sp.]
MAQFGLIGVMATAGGNSFAQFAGRLFVVRHFFLHWTALAFLVGLSAAAGVLIDRLRATTKMRKPDGESSLGELAMLRAIVANLPDLIYVKDSRSRFLLANQGVADVVGAAASADLLGKTDFEFFPEEMAAGFFEDERKVLLSGRPMVSREEKVGGPDATTQWILTTKVPLLDTAGQTAGIIGIGRNITGLKEVEAELRRVQEELEFKAAHDCLTPLMNRGAILEMLERELARSVREKSCTAVLLGDLDHFKDINDAYGHPVGDEVLLEVAHRLIGTVRIYDLVGRYGGEEFLVVLPGCPPLDAMARAGQLREAIAASPIATTQGLLPMTISIGVLVAQEWGQPTSAEILREVDAALYAAKVAGRDRCSLAQPALRS